MKLAKARTPNTYFILSSIVVLMAVLTWIIPAGVYNTIIVNGRELVDGGSFHFVDSSPQNFYDVLIAPIRGFVESSLIIALILFVGGAFGVFQKTGAVDAAIIAIAKAHSKSKVIRILLIPILVTIFSTAGSIWGMSEEIIPFILFFVPLALVLGYDTITGLAIPFVGAGVGFAGAFLNPFTLGIAQGIADLPLFSGITYRIFVWAIITTTAILFIMRYAKKVKQNPEISITYESDKKKRSNLHIDDFDNHESMDKKHKLVLLTFIIGIAVLIYGVLRYGWYMEEIGALFIITGLAVAVAGRLTIKETTDSFLDGAKNLVGTALVVAFARAILVIASDGKVIDTILYSMSSLISDFHPIISSQVMFIVQSLLNFFVPSGSGQAALTMPIMAPLGDLVGVSRQTAVLAFQFGDGFTNMIIPTSAVTMGVLALAEVPWEKWARWLIPLQLILFLIGLLLLIPPYFLNWQ